MFEFIERENDEIISVRASGKLTHDDYEEFTPRLASVMETFDEPVLLYVELDQFEGWEPRALWDDLKFGASHFTDFKKVAIVGDQKWQEIGVKMSNFLMPAQVRYFEDKNVANDWLNETGAETQA